MPSMHGLEWSGTSGGKLDESEIPDPPEHKSHYIEDADTKSDSSFPVVDGNDELRRGNVGSAWDLRGHSERDDIEPVLKDLGEEFENNPIPDEAYEQNNALNINEELAFSASSPSGLNFERFSDKVGTGFNEHGVRENRDEDGNLESVDVIFEAMEPGPPRRRNGVRITPEFLRTVANKDYSNEPPHLRDHKKRNTFARIGRVKRVWFDSQREKLMLMTRTPNIERSRAYTEAVARYTHNPPEITDGSLGFGQQYEVVENSDGEPELVDGKLREFSTVNFPGGYDEGGVRAAFAKAVQEATEFEGHMDGDVDREQLEAVHQEWDSLVNMSEEEMEMWDEHPCSDHGLEDSENWRDNTLMLMGQPMESWNREAVEVANQTIAFLNEMMDRLPDEPESGGPGSCPSREAISMLNRGHNPLDSWPTGNPEFSIQKKTVEFDDVPQKEPDGDGTENSAAEDSTFEVETETTSF